MTRDWWLTVAITLYFGILVMLKVWGAPDLAIGLIAVISAGTVVLLTDRVAGFPVGETLLVLRRGHRLWTVHAQTWRLRRLFWSAIASGHNPCPLIARRMIEDLALVERLVPPGTLLRLDTWMVGPRTRRWAEAHGWNVEPVCLTWRMKLDLHLSWLLMPRAARRRCRGPFSNGSAAMFRVSKTV